MYIGTWANYVEGTSVFGVKVGDKFELCMCSRIYSWEWKEYAYFMSKVVPKFADAVKKVVTRERCAHAAELNFRWLDDEDLVDELLKDMCGQGY